MLQERMVVRVETARQEMRRMQEFDYGGFSSQQWAQRQIISLPLRPRRLTSTLNACFLQW